MPRKRVHTRLVRFDGFHRDDGLWDIEAELADSKSYPIDTLDRVHLVPGDDVHRMRIRVTLDSNYVVRSIEAAVLAAPFGECQAAIPPMQGFEGVRLGKGWRKAIDERLGGIKGCTHLRELLFNMATAAFQTIPHYQHRMLGVVPAPGGPPPAQMGGCMSWDFDGPVVRRVAPEFAGYRVSVSTAAEGGRR